MASRILQICPHDEMPFGGICDRFAEAAQRLGAEVVSVFLGAPAAAPRAHAEYLNAPDLADTVALSQRLADWQADWDLLLCHRYRAYWSAARAGLQARRRIALAHEFGLLARWQRRLNRRWRGRGFEFAGVSPAVAAELSQVTGHAHVLPNVLADGAALRLVDRASAQAEMGLAGDGFTVGVVGRLHYKKRPGLALEAFEQFAATRPDARLVFLGDGDERPAIAAAAGDKVYLPGVIADAQRLYHGFDVLLHPCDVEAFGMVPLEAMLAGVPVVTHAGGGPRYVLDGLGCYASDESAAAFAAALAEAAGADREQLRSAGQDRVARLFSVEALAGLLGKLLAGESARG